MGLYSSFNGFGTTNNGDMCNGHGNLKSLSNGPHMYPLLTPLTNQSEMACFCLLFNLIYNGELHNLSSISSSLGSTPIINPYVIPSITYSAS